MTEILTEKNVDTNKTIEDVKQAIMNRVYKTVTNETVGYNTSQLKEILSLAELCKKD
jgi:hypothetical protein